ncbi:hypothetical protein RUND412_011538, partial [Rhizina undulata]
SQQEKKTQSASANKATYPSANKAISPSANKATSPSPNMALVTKKSTFWKRLERLINQSPKVVDNLGQDDEEDNGCLTAAQKAEIHVQ